MERTPYALESRGRRLFLGSRTWLMGVVNVTPDSFSDGGLFIDPDRAVERGLELASEGADILDIGGESTRPGAGPVAAEEELRRIIPVVRGLRRRTDVPISVDTTKAAVAREALDEGADIVNDVSALRFDAEMAQVIAASGAAVVLMHMQGTPLTMQLDPRYDDLLGEIRSFFLERLRAAEEAGIPADRTVIDPGVGFGKTCAHNLALLNGLEAFRDLGRPLCVGLSRKAFIGKVLDLPPGERVEGTIAAAVLSVTHGAHILRVHDVREVARAVRVAEAILTAEEAVDNGRNGKASHVC
jgi:dihydropteroate synthase